jgi:cobaltochelatase CobN
MNNDGTTKITYVSFLGFSELIDAIKDINKDYGEIIDLKLYSTNEVEEGSITNDFKDDLITSHIVFIDGRGGDRLSQIIRDTLSGIENTVLTIPPSMSFGTYYASSMDGILIRMGSIRSDSLISKFESDNTSKKLLNSKFFRSILKILVKLFDNDIDIDAILDRFDMTSIKDPQKFIDTIWKISPMFDYLPKRGIFKDYKNMFLINYYFWSSSKENMKNFLLLLAKEYGNLKTDVKIEPPILMKDDAIYHPDADKFFYNLDDYAEWRGLDKDSTVGMIFYGTQFYEMYRPTVDLLIRDLERSANVICVVMNRSFAFHNIMERFFFKDGKPRIDLFIWPGAYHRMTGGPLWGGPEELFKVLKRLNVPVLAPFGMVFTTIDVWERSDFIAPMDITCAVMAPELDGVIEPIPIMALKKSRDSDLDIKYSIAVPIEDRVVKVCRRAVRWINLKKKDNADKKVAIVIYNYPPGEGNLGGGAGYLDVFESLFKMLEGMKKEGYTVDLPETKEDLLNMFLDNVQVNTADRVKETAEYATNIPIEKYLSWLNDIPERPREKILDSYGDPPGDIMTYNKKLLVPGVRLGNVFIGPQPSIVSPDKIDEIITAYHDKTTAPHHQFLAFYKWIDEEFDALIHFGTHGLLEFREGKEVGMSKDCFPDVLIGDIPHIYLYMVDDAAEATIAKRRSYALMISHASPAYTISDVYYEYAELEDLINEYYRALTSDPQRAEIVYEMLMEQAEDVHLEGSVEDIHEKIYEMKRSIIPKGLHILGENLDDDEIVEYVTLVLRYDRGDVKSMHRVLSENKGYDYETMLKHPSEKPNGSDKNYVQILDGIEDDVKGIVRDLLKDRDVNYVIDDLAIKDINVKKDIKTTLLSALDLINRIESSDEVNSILNALDAGFILPCKGGDMVRSPEVLPTGRNIYQFDATKVPTAAAYERGVRIAEEVVRKYLDENGRYPESIGIVLWGFETSNTEGETIGEILRLIGVEIVSSLTDKRCGWGYFSDLRLISLEELGRPRIDVTINICGMFRDMFPHLLELLDKAFKMVSELDESRDKNLVARHTEELKEKAREIGIDPDLAHIRTFGPANGDYGTILPMFIDSSEWDSEDDLADEYLFAMKHAYGKNIHAEDLKKAFEFHASKVEVVSQVRDFTDFEITDLDHYYEFTGGFATAVKKLSGQRPEMYITDTTKEIIKTEDVKDAIERGSRTRTLNPKWIDEMLKHGYDGALNISDRVDNIMGFAATTGKVADWVWDEVCDRYVFDEETRKKIEEANPWATKEIIDRLFEAEKRGYWNATEERMEKLKELYLEVEGWVEDRGDNIGKPLKGEIRDKMDEKRLLGLRGEERSRLWREFLDKELK